MKSKQRHIAGTILSVLLAGASAACAGAGHEPKAPQSAGARRTTQAEAIPRAANPPASILGASSPGASGLPNMGRNGQREQSEADDVELVVSREVVGNCPTLRLVRDHYGEFDADMVWLAVLVAIADCMGEGGTMAGRAISISGDMEHQAIVREILGWRGIPPVRLLAPPSSSGVAECQGGTNCSKQVIITMPTH